MRGKPPVAAVTYNMPAIYDSTVGGFAKHPMFLIASLHQSTDLVVQRKALRLRSNREFPWPCEKWLVFRSKTEPVLSG